MKKIVVTDIFGRTPRLEALVGRLRGECEILDPYAGRARHFSSEPEAYRAFSDEVGLERYTARLRKRVLEHSAPVSVLGV